MKTKTITRRTRITEEIVETETVNLKTAWTKNMRTWLYDLFKIILPFLFRRIENH